MIRSARRHGALVVLILACALAIPGSAGAATPAKTLGPTPVETDCLYYQDESRGCYYDIGYIDATISDHLLRVGERFTVASTGSSAFGPWSWYHPPNSKIVSCTPAAEGHHPQGTSGVCEYEATAPTNGWLPGAGSQGAGANSSVFFGAALHCCTIGSYIDGDFFAVAGPHIEGTVTEEDGDPIEDVTVSIVGEETDGEPVDVVATTEANGYYHAILADGSYEVSGSHNGRALCVRARPSTCVEKATESPDATVDFRTDGYAEIEGKVTNLKDEPVGNVTLRIADPTTGDPVANATTRADGTYEADLEERGTYTVTPVLEDELFDPATETVTVDLGEEAKADFKLYEALEVTIESGRVSGAVADPFAISTPFSSEGRFDVAIKVANLAPAGGATIENLEPINRYGVQVATDAFPLAQTGRIAMRYVSDTPPSSLAPGETFEYFIQPQALSEGLVALRATFSGTVTLNGVEKRVTESHDARILIEDRKILDENERQLSAMAATGAFLDETSGMLRKVLHDRAIETHKALHLKLDGKTERVLFGDPQQLKVTRAEQALARMFGMTPEHVAVVTPNTKLKKLDTVDQFALYNAARMKSERQLLKKWWDGSGGKVYNGLANEVKFWWQKGSAEGLAQLGTRMTGAWEAYKINQTAAIDAFFASPADARKALVASTTAVNKQIETMGQQGAIESARFNQKLADHYRHGEYRQAQEMVADRDTKLVMAVADQVFGELTGRVQETIAGKVIQGVGTGLYRAAEKVQESGVLNARALQRTVRVGDEAKAGLPTYFSDLPETARVAIGLDRMRALGGITGRDANIARRHVAQVNSEVAEEFGDAVRNVDVGMVARPVNPFEAAGAFAKVEVVGVKSVNPIDLLLGAHPDALGQPGIFRPRDPSSLPRWKSYSAAEQADLQDRFSTRMTEFVERYGDPPPNSKMTEMRRAIGERIDITVTGQNAEQTKVYKLELDARTAKGGGYSDTEILSYKHLEINGDVLHTGRARPIGTDLDKVGYIDAKTGAPLPPDVEDYVDRRMKELGRESAVSEGYSEPFHGATLRREAQSDLSAEQFLQFGHYGLTHLSEKKAREVANARAATYNALFPDRKPVTADDFLKKVRKFNAPAILITSEDVIFGPLQFTDP